MQCAFGCWRQGLCVGTIYSTLGEDGALFGLNQSEAKVVIADGKLLKVLTAA
jgi:long-chain acyl-CoA synthetase